MTTFRIVAVFLAAIAAAAGWILSREAAPAPYDSRMALLSQPRPVGEFSLYRADTGAPFNNAGLQDRWSLVYSGFSRCPDLCPTTLALLARVKKQFTGASPLQIVFISVDPDFDTDSVLASYVSHFDADIIPLAGGMEQTTAALRALSFLAPGKVADGAGVAHSGAVALIGPGRQLRGLFRYPQNETYMLTTLYAVQRNAGRHPSRYARGVNL